MATHPPSSVTVPCRCGAFHIISLSQFGRSQTCRKCGSGYSVVWKRDARTGKNSPLVVAAAKARRARASTSETSPGSLIDLACSCGYRRRATPEEFRRGLTCPGCANPMYVDRAPRPPAPLGPPPVPFVEKTRYGSSPLIPKIKIEPPTASRPKLSARPPSGDLPKVSATKRMMSGKILVICSYCGARLLVGAEHQGKNVTCMGCDKAIPVWGPPSAATPPAFRSPSSPTPSGGTRFFDAPGMPPPAFLDGPTLDCPCGAVMDVRGASPGSVHTCPTCRRQVTMEKRRHPQTLTTVMLPIFSEPLPEPEPEPTVSLEPGTLEIYCECGAPLLVSRRDVGHPVQCPGCSLLFEIQQTPDGLKVKPIGRIDEQDWSLQDFK